MRGTQGTTEHYRALGGHSYYGVLDFVLPGTSNHGSTNRVRYGSVETELPRLLFGKLKWTECTAHAELSQCAGRGKSREVIRRLLQVHRAPHVNVSALAAKDWADHRIAAALLDRRSAPRSRTQRGFRASHGAGVARGCNRQQNALPHCGQVPFNDTAAVRRGPPRACARYSDWHGWQTRPPDARIARKHA